MHIIIISSDPKNHKQKDTFECCVITKVKHEIELIPNGQQVIKSE
jgi:hypothetical protein